MECTICYKKIDEGTCYNKWTCTHSFHKKCIIDWNKSCPVCRCEDRNIETYTEITTLRSRFNLMKCLCAQAHENKMFFGDKNGTICIWNIETYEEIASLNNSASASVVCLCAQAHENKLFSGSGDQYIRVWNTDTYEPIAALRTHTIAVYCLAIYENKLFSGGGGLG